MKKFGHWQSLALFSLLLLGVSCSDDDATTSTSGASAEATFAETLLSAMPDGLKVGSNAEADRRWRLIHKALTSTGGCDTAYTSCPFVVDEGGDDSSTGEILSKLWAIDYNDECTAAMLSDGSCFSLSSGGQYSTYIMPTILANPEYCTLTEDESSEMELRYLNFGVDPCYFDSMLVSRLTDSYDNCKENAGTDYDISTIIPWYSEWGIPQEIRFSGFSGTAGAGIYWTVDNTDNKKYFVSIDDDWMHGGIKDTENNKFFFFASGSPSYYESNGEDSGMNLSAYAGDIPVNGVLGEFEILQMRDQGDQHYIKRMLINETHVWYQSWSSLPATDGAVATFIASTPDDNRCLEIGASISTSKYVPFSECYTAFGKASLTEMNDDDNFELKIFSQAKLNDVDFSTRLIATDSGCL